MKRREANRVPYPEKCKLTLRSENEDVTHHLVEIRNLSVGGLAVISNKNFSSGELLTISFGTAQQEQSVINGTVKHCIENGKGNYIIGIQFDPESSSAT